MDTDSSLAPLAPLEDACTVVLLRDGSAGLETLMLERPGNSSSFGGAWVFPGGKVDPGDRVDAAGRSRDDLAAAQAAGLRELAEETGQQLAAEQLVWLSQWTPMQAIPRRFRTWFMLAAAADAGIVLNPEEHERAEWLTPRTILALHAAGRMKLVPPTWVTLHYLAAMESTAQALELARDSEPFTYNTHLLQPDTGAPPAGVVWAGDEAYPEAPGEQPANNGPRPGARHRLTLTALPWVFERTGS